MGFLNSLFTKETPIDISIANPTITNTSGTVTKSFSTVWTGKGYFWQGGQAEGLVNERIRADISGVIAIDYEDMTATIKDGAKATIGSSTYNMITEDNILLGNELLIYPVVEFK